MKSPQWFQEAFDAPYLEVYAHRNQQEADQATACLLEPLGLPGLQVLDLACGAGRWLRPLAQAGADVVGVDLSLPLLERAAQMRRETQLPFDLLRCDMLHIPLRSNSRDLVLSMFTSFGYFDEPEQDIAVLQEAHRVLRMGGGSCFWTCSMRIGYAAISSQKPAAMPDVLRCRNLDVLTRRVAW